MLHEVLIFNLMKCAGVIRKKESLLRYGGVDWREFMLMYFEEICSRTEASYRSKLVAATIEKNLALADRLLTQ